MKKLIGLFLLAGMFTFAACGGKKAQAPAADTAAAAPHAADTTKHDSTAAAHGADHAGDAAAHGEKKAAH